MDLEQLVENSITYNGPNSQFTHTAERMKQVGLDYLEQVCAPSLPMSLLYVPPSPLCFPSSLSLPFPSPSLPPQEAEILAALESQLPAREARSESRSPAAFLQEGSMSSMETASSQMSGNDPGSLAERGDTMILESGMMGAVGEEIDVEGLDDVVMEGADLHSVLLQDLQHSSSSSDSDSGSEDSEIEEQ